MIAHSVCCITCTAPSGRRSALAAVPMESCRRHSPERRQACGTSARRTSSAVRRRCPRWAGVGQWPRGPTERVAQNGAFQRVHWQRSLSGREADHRLAVGERVQHVEVGPRGPVRSSGADVLGVRACAARSAQRAEQRSWADPSNALDRQSVTDKKGPQVEDSHRASLSKHRSSPASSK